MSIYEVKKIDISGIKTVDDYTAALNSATPVRLSGLKAVQDFCGVMLRRERAGYSASSGKYEFVITRVA